MSNRTRSKSSIAPGIGSGRRNHLGATKKPDALQEPAPRPNLHRLQWNNDHRNTNCPSVVCGDHSDHFRIWLETYQSYLERLYASFSQFIKPSKVSFPEFAEFAYSNSSGYISRYA